VFEKVVDAFRSLAEGLLRKPSHAGD